MKIEVFGFHEDDRYCQYCEQAKSLLKRKKLPFTYYPLRDEKAKEDLLKRLNKADLTGTTMPRVFINGELIGGYTELNEYFRKLG